MNTNKHEKVRDRAGVVRPRWTTATPNCAAS